MASMDESQRAEIYKTGLNSTEFLISLAEVTIGWLLLRQAELAQDHLDAGVVGTGGQTGTASPSDQDFYTGKVASARWFLRTVPPKVALRRAKAQEEDGWLMDVPEAAF
jgi:hypothetical protein